TACRRLPPFETTKRTTPTGTGVRESELRLSVIFTVTGVTAAVAAPAVTSAAKNPIRLRKRIRDPLRYNRVVLRNRGYIIAAAAILPGHRPVLSHRPHVTPIMKELADEPVAFEGRSFRAGLVSGCGAVRCPGRLGVVVGGAAGYGGDRDSGGG